VIRLDAATVLLQWAAGGLLFLWVTTRGRQVGIGYGWTVRATFLLMALGAAALGLWLDPVPVREASAFAVAIAAGVALVVSVVRRKAGVRGERELRARRSERVRVMLEGEGRSPGAEQTGISRRRDQPDATQPEFPPWLDLMAPLVAVPGLVAAGVAAGDPALLSVARVLVGAAFLGAISDAMLLGHWYLVQPGLSRRPLLELVRWTGYLWPLEMAVLLWPTGMVSVLAGTVDDGWDGLLGWFWLVCGLGTAVLVVVTRLALRERYYSAVMAATGLLYLAILTAFGTDLIARAVLAGAT
jgi:hypothetical protein